MSPASRSPEAARAKTHRKSRAGCFGCKRRKIKCDETRPECQRCQTFGIPCDYLGRSGRHAVAADAAPEDPDAPRARRLGRPRGDWVKAYLASFNKSPATTTSPRKEGREIPAEAGTPSLLPVFDLDEIHIHHHYLTVTAPTLGHTHIWRDGIPQLARASPAIVSGMLSVAAFHLARTQSIRTPANLLIAEKHYAAAVQAITEMIPHMSADNCQVIYTVAILVCFTAFARGPRPGNLLLFATDDGVAWFPLLRGVKMVLEEFGVSVIMSGVLDHTAPQAARQAGCNCPLVDVQPREVRFGLRFPGWNWEASLDKLLVLVATPSDDDGLVFFRPHVIRMIEAFKSFTEPRPFDDDNRVIDFNCIMSWVYGLEDSFIERLRERNQVALIILGTFAVLLASIKGYWWLEGWGDHVLKELRPLMGTEYSEWLP